MGLKTQVDSEHAAGERDAYLEMVDLAASAAESNPYEIRNGLRDALDAARWATGADGSDPGIRTLLQNVAQFGVAMHTSIVGKKDAVPLRGRLVSVAPGLPVEGLTVQMWSHALWAATASGDAASAVRLARIDPQSIASGAAPGEGGIASALASVWTGDGAVGKHLIAGLEATDPQDVPESVVDFVLQIVVPVAAAFQAIVGEGAGGNVDAAIRDGVERYEGFWGVKEADGLLALQLTALCVLASQLRVPTSVEHRLLPPAVIGMGQLDVELCPVCAEPFDEAQDSCVWCGADLHADAPMQHSLGEWLAAARTPCSKCSNLVHPLALRCWSCSAPRG